jgi:hypothetical protein
LSRVRDLPVGSTLAKIRRAVFVLGGDLAGDGGDLELSFENGQTFSFGVAGNGESLAIEPNRWPEYFTEPVSAENRAFIQSSGKWEILDLGELTWSYRQFLGRRLLAADCLGDSGALLDFDGMYIRVEVVADDLRVNFES